MVPIRRYARRWRTYLAYGGLVLAGILLGAERTPLRAEDTDGEVPVVRLCGQYGEYCSNNPANETQPQPPGALGIIPIPPRPLIYTYSCTNPENAEQENFCVQRRAAKAAEKQASWAAATFGVGFVGTVAIVITLIYTSKSANAALVGARAAEDAVNASLAALAHAQDAAARDLRPWITIEAFLDGPIEANRWRAFFPLGGGHNLSFFIRLRAKNVGKTAAHNVIYWVSAVDLQELEDRDEWFEGEIAGAVAAARWGTADHVLDRYNDSLAPSEEYRSRCWCSVQTSKPADRPHWKAYELCVCVVAAYTGEIDATPFYTAKVWPIGYPEVPTFRKFIGPSDLPIGTGDVALGPVRKAKST